MNSYELMYILPAKLSDDEKKAVNSKVDGLVKEIGGTVVSHKEWLTRKLSYPINRIRQGTFMLAHLTLPLDIVPKLTRELELDESILRHQTVKAVRGAKAPAPGQAPRVLPQAAIDTLGAARTTTPVKEAAAQEQDEVSKEQLVEKLEELLDEDKPIIK